MYPQRSFVNSCTGQVAVLAFETVPVQELCQILNEYWQRGCVNVWICTRQTELTSAGLRRFNWFSVSDRVSKKPHVQNRTVEYDTITVSFVCVTTTRCGTLTEWQLLWAYVCKNKPETFRGIQRVCHKRFARCTVLWSLNFFIDKSAQSTITGDSFDNR